jgi:hypothetical protein
MGPRNGWLFPLMVVAAGSVTAFGCIGIAAITGHLPLVRGGVGPLGGYSAAPTAIIEQTVTPRANPGTGTPQPVAVVAEEGRSAATTKAIALQPGKPVGVRKKSSEPTVN